MTSTTLKLKTRPDLAVLREELRTRGKTVGFTSGNFDVLHPGHVAYLEQAKAQCDILMVGVNTDASVRLSKGESRPVCSAEDRARVVCALACVDYVFLFEEKNNHRNIELLKPDLYLKAGDYEKSTLTSAPLVESYGGRAVIIPALPGHSTTRIIQKISAQALGDLAAAIPQEPRASAPAVFVDRDGTIVEHVEYLHEPEKLRFIAGAVEALRSLKQAGYRIVVITNQPGIGVGYYTKEEFFAVNREMMRALFKAGVALDRVYYCPHTDGDKCSCRKPNTALIERAVREINVRLADSFVIGDMTIDIQLGINAGCRPILVHTGYGGSDNRYDAAPAYVARDLSAAAQWILQQRPAP